MANYVHKTGYVIGNDPEGGYVRGFKRSGGKTMPYYNVNLECAKVWLTRKGADNAAPIGSVTLKVRLDELGRAQKVT